MTTPTPYPPGGPVYSEQITAAVPQAPPPAPAPLDPALVAAVAAQLAQAQPAPVAAPIPQQPPARKAERKPPKGDDGVTDDFDAMWAEKRAKAPKLKIFGRIYTLPPTMPASAVLYVESNRHRSSSNIAAAEAIEIINGLIGKNALDELLAEGLGIDELFDLVRHCMRVYNLGDDEGEAEAEAAATSSA